MKNDTIIEISNYMKDAFMILYFRYNNKGIIEYTNADLSFFKKLLDRTNIINYAMNEYKDYSKPLVFIHNLGFTWTIVFESNNDKLSNFHIFGPYISKDINIQNIISDSFINHDIKPSFIDKLRKYLLEIPNVQISSFYKQILLINYVLNNISLNIPDLNIKTEINEENNNKNNSNPLIKTNYDDVLFYYNLERKVLLNIETGNLDYQNDFSLYEKYLANSEICSKEDKSQMVFISLCVRSAIKGGLSAHKAYELGYKYNELLAKSTNSSSNRDTIREIYHLFCSMTASIKNNNNYSKPIKSTIDYINSNIESKITINSLASRVGYTDYYLTRLFKKEIGENINTYIKRLKIERAKTLLETTDYSITQIAYNLGFESRSNFVYIFEKFENISPKDYRKKMKSY